MKWNTIAFLFGLAPSLVCASALPLDTQQEIKSDITQEEIFNRLCYCRYMIYETYNEEIDPYAALKIIDKNLEEILDTYEY